MCKGTCRYTLNGMSDRIDISVDFAGLKPLGELGLSPAEVEDLWTQGVTGDWPSAIPRP